MTFPSIRFKQPRGNNDPSARRAFANLSGAINQATSEILDAVSNASNYYSRIYRSSDVSVGPFGIVSWVGISWNAETSDSPGWHDNATNPTRVTVDQTGMYTVTGMISWDGTASTPVATRIQVNGTTDYFVEHNVVSVSTYGTTFTLAMSLTAGDYFEVAVRQGAGVGTATVKGGERLTWLFTQYLGA